MLETTREKFMARVSTHPTDKNSCWLWMGPRGKRKNKNYGYCYLLKPEQQAHRVSYMLFKGPIPAGAQILHKCDNPPCVNPKHLRPGTPQDNVDDREKRGRSRHPIGTAHGRAKLTEKQVEEIRTSYIPVLKPIKGEIQIGSQQFLANKYGVTKRAIRLILRNISYRVS
jgi:hypothetical protein